MNKALYCGGCNQIFSGKDVNQQHGLKTPILLKCSHTVCESCVRKIVKVQKSGVLCPFCQELTPIKSGDVKSLPPDIYIMGLSMIKKTTMDQATILKLTAAGVIVAPKKQSATSPGGASGSKTDNVIRELCGECCSNEATVACLKCECNMCGRCFDKVHQAKILRSHQAIPFGQSDGEISPSSCSTHDNRPYEYYCEDDKVAVCSKCVIHGKHQGHAISSLEEKNRAVLADIDPAIHVTQKVIKKMKTSSKTIDTKFPEIKADLEKKIAIVNLHFHAMHSQLQQREISLINELQNAYRKVTEPLHQMKTFLEEQQIRYDSLIKDARRLHSSQHAAMNGKGILDQLTEAKHSDCIIKTPDTKELDIWCKFTDELTDHVLVHGEIVCDEKPIGYIIEALDDVEESDTPGESSDAESIATQASTASKMTESSATSDDVIVEETVVTGALSGGEKSDGSLLDLDKISVTSDGTEKSETKKPTLGTLRLDGYNSEVVSVTHIHHPCRFTVQVQSDEKKLVALSRNINRWCSSVDPKKYVPAEVEIDDLVLAQFTKDDKWYRARVKDFNLDDSGKVPVTNVDVVYVDFGNSETLPKTRLRKMQKKFLKDAEFGIQCSLIDIVPPDKKGQWSNEAVTTFARMTGDSTMLMMVQSHSNDVLYVDLSKPPNEEIADDKPISVRDALVFLELAVFLSPQSVDMPHTKKYPSERQFLPPELPDPGETFPSFVCHINSPSDFFVQSLGGDEAAYLATMTHGLQKFYNMDKGELWTIFCPRLEMMCVAKHSADQRWYRARVIALPGAKQVTVEYVDYGNVENVNIWMLKKIMDQFLILPAQALRCRLADIRPHDQQWDPEVISSFVHMSMPDKVITMKVVAHVKNALSVIAFDAETEPEICLNAELVRANLAISTGPCSKPQKVNPLVKTREKVKKELKPEQISDIGTESSAALSPSVYSESDTELSFFPVIVSNVISPGEIYLQTTTAMDDGLEKLMTDLASKYKDSEASIVRWEKDACCAVQYSEDDTWYRGRITKIDEDNVEVHVLDFGYKERTTVRNLRVLDEEFLDLPCFALKSFMDDIQPAGDKYKWSQTAIEFLKDVLPQKKLCQVAKNGDIVDGSLPVVLLAEQAVEADALNAASISNVSVSKLLKDKGVALPIRRKPKPKKSSQKETKPPPPPPKPKRRMEENLGTSYMEPLPPSLPVLNVVPTYVNYDCVIFVQRTDDSSETLTSLMEQIQEEFEDSIPEEDILWEKGMSVCAQFSDDQMWYRARIVEIDHRGIQVIYVDYGNSEIVPPERLRTKLMFMDIPLQCYECELKGIITSSGDQVWPVNTLNYLHNLIVGNQCILIVKDQPVYGKKLQINLEVRGIDVSTHLCNFGYAINLEPEPDVVIEETESTLELEDDELSVIPDPSPCRPKPASWCELVEQEESAEIKPTCSEFKKLPLPEVGEYFSFTTTNVIAPNEIYGQYKKQDVKGDEDDDPEAVEINRLLDSLIAMNYEMNQAAHAFHLLKNPKPGMACCCQYTYDEQWYRSEIIDITDDQCQVLYVDYGNGETQPLSSLRMLPKEYLELPAMAIHCLFDGIKIPEGETEWQMEAIHRMSDCLGLAADSGIACLKDQGPPAVIDLYSSIPIPGEPVPYVYLPLMEDGLIEKD